MFQTTGYEERKVKRLQNSVRYAEKNRELELSRIKEQEELDIKYENFSRKEQSDLEGRLRFWGLDYKEDEPNTWSCNRGK